ncbi:CPBP family intramembrane glutamic endopeptidase [Staphylococcus epidermidis]|uniref:CPBP family intramembrane glutamic endopeptidase n=1 Tax=Staphylococcus epidermidis TaxID=1282 RepID=UPI00294B88A3|nr:CPBP family intramembrane glutamic endopeptidase [Staphylococcus epidermidis]
MSVLHKHLSNILSIVMIIILGILCFELCIQLKFLGDRYKNIYVYLIMIVTSVVIYTFFKNYVKRKEIIKSKYLKPKKMSWKSNIIIILLSIIFDSALKQPFPSKSENQNRVEESQKGMDIFTALIDSSISPGIIEEICFRGILFIIILASSSYLFNYNKKRFDWIGLITFFVFSSVFFGFVHVAKSYDIQNIGGYIMSGIVLSFIFLLTRDLKLPIIVHALGNAFSIFYRYDMQFINYILLSVLVITCLYCVLKQYKKVGEYGDYIEYRVKKKIYEKKLKKRR